MTAYTYADVPHDAAHYPLIGNPNRHFHPTRLKPILLAVMHITAGLDDFEGNDGSAEATVAYSSTTATVASYHGIVDSDSIIDCLPDSYTAFAQGVVGHNFNSPGLALEIGTLKSDWRTKPAWWVERTLRNAAAWWAPRVVRYRIPIRVVRDRNEIDRLIAADQPVGFTSHGVLSPGTRTDPGLVAGVDTFPWEQFFGYLREAINGTTNNVQEDKMTPEQDQMLRTVYQQLCGEGAAPGKFTGWLTRRIGVDQKRLTLVDYLRDIDAQLNSALDLGGRPGGDKDNLWGHVLSARATLKQLAAKVGGS